ncbi:hypothetical protein [Methanocalculus sp.]|uniref:hypothetical protein n=1 Tax=Methanocalculus sp. TaxID=2004547 RepID=UPI00260A405A|nr:hypothetical protein [Methanocalculus sp.]MDG6250822.1 hypothetical protein [Methanocalculus sp.]
MMPEARDVNPIAGCLTPHEEIRILAEAAGIDLNEAVAKRRAKLQEEAAEKERIKAEQARMVEEARKAREQKTFEEGIRAGFILGTIDGKIIKTVPFCKDGGELGDMQALYHQSGTARSRLTNGRHGFMAMVQAFEGTFSIPCTCEQGSHVIRLFISGEK